MTIALDVFFFKSFKTSNVFLVCYFSRLKSLLLVNFNPQICFLLGNLICTNKIDTLEYIYHTPHLYLGIKMTIYSINSSFFLCALYLFQLY